MEKGRHLDALFNQILIKSHKEERKSTKKFYVQLHKVSYKMNKIRYSQDANNRWIIRYLQSLEQPVLKQSISLSSRQSFSHLKSDFQRIRSLPNLPWFDLSYLSIKLELFSKFAILPVHCWYEIYQFLFLSVNFAKFILIDIQILQNNPAEEECMLNRLLLISLEVCLNLVLVNIRLLDYYQRRDGCRYVSPYLVTNLITSICTVKW